MNTRIRDLFIAAKGARLMLTLGAALALLRDWRMPTPNSITPLPNSKRRLKPRRSDKSKGRDKQWADYAVNADRRPTHER